MIRIDAPIVANQTLAAASAIFSWAIRQEILTVNPCKLVDRNPTTDRERVLSDDRGRAAVGEARPGAEADPAHRPAARRSRGHAARSHRRGLVADAGQAAGRLAGHQERTRSPGRALRARAGADRAPPRREGGSNKSSNLLRKLVAELKIERATPHDLRRTCLTWITRLGFGRDAMDRVANHKTSSGDRCLRPPRLCGRGQADHVGRGAAHPRRRQGDRDRQRGQPEVRYSLRARIGLSHEEDGPRSCS